MWTYLTNTLRDPNGVTRIAGAKAYAVKLAISPTTTEKKNAVFILRKEKKPHVLTKSPFCYNSSCTSCWIGMRLDNLSSDWLKCKQHSSKMAVVKLYQSVHNGQYMYQKKPNENSTWKQWNEWREAYYIILWSGPDWPMFFQVFLDHRQSQTREILDDFGNIRKSYSTY